MKFETLAILAGTEQLYWMKWPTWSNPRLLELQPKMDWYLHIHFVNRGLHFKYTWPLRGMVGHRQSLKVCVTSLVDSSCAKPRVNLLSLVWKWYRTSWSLRYWEHDRPTVWDVSISIYIYQSIIYIKKKRSSDVRRRHNKTNYSICNDTCVFFFLFYSNHKRTCYYWPLTALWWGVERSSP